MTSRIVNKNDINIAVITSDEIIINDVQSALDFIATVWYDTGCNRIVLNKSAICEDFFRLRTRLAGEVLQKFVNYNTKLAIVGDFSACSSESLKAFIYESNKGKDIFFLPDENQAVDKLSSV